MKRKADFIKRVLIIFLFFSILSNGFAQLNRSYSGALNHVGTLWGAMYDTIVQIAPPAFSDGISLPAGDDRPNPRLISNMMFDQRDDINDPLGLTAYVWAWGQFIDHDITLSPNTDDEALPILVPMGDRFFDPERTGEVEIGMMRADYLPYSGTSSENPRRYYNATTAFIDASGVYGTDEERASWLRTFQNGKMKTSANGLLPYNTMDGEVDSEIDVLAPHMDIPFPHLRKWFIAGDPRANENPMLTAIHTLFVLEHNRLCDEIALENSDWTDEEIFQKARKIVGAQIQAIVYEEWLPAVGINLPTYSGYDASVNPGITNTFITAAYRYGHTTITPNLPLMDNDGNDVGEGEVALRDVFFNPQVIQEYGGLDPFLIGGAFIVEQDLDCKVIDDLRNFLFGQPGSGGLDLVSLNINRGRDRGLADFNTIRQYYGMEPLTSFRQFSNDPILTNMMEELYGDVNTIDPWVGFLAEAHEPGALFGPTVMKVLSHQFSNLQLGDRFYYEMDEGLSEAEKLTIKNTRLGDIIKRNTSITLLEDDVFHLQTDELALYRTIDGTENNLNNPEWGAAGENFIIETPLHYTDGMSSPAGEERPNPRMISNAIFAQDSPLDDPLNLSAYTWAWGQFIDHDITLSGELEDEIVSFAIPKYDVFFDPQGTGTQTMSLHRSAYDEATGDHIGNPRTPINGITAYIDGSAVYGSDEERAAWLRTGVGGKLKTSSGDLPPYNTISGELNDEIDENAPKMAMPFPHVSKFFVAGDVRANENPLLLSIHTLFIREHNRQCDRLAQNNPEWTDEQIYQYARKIVGGKIEAIVYEEWLPTLGMNVPEYQGYNELTQPGISNVFATAAYRYGHSTINSELMRMDVDGNVIPEGNLLLRDAYFNPNAITDIGGIFPYLQGMANVVQQNFDCHVIDDLRNFLFGIPGSGGLDLVALNIMRGRERGLADYNSVRAQYGMQPIENFAQLSSDPMLNQHFASVYKEVDNIDPWAGFLAENHMPGALFGETAMYIIKKQFMALRDGDYFYYENDPLLTEEEILEIKNTTLAQIVMDNSEVYDIQDNVFIFTQSTSSQDLVIRDHGISVFPNPTTDYLNVEWDETFVDLDNPYVKIFDISGQEVSAPQSSERIQDNVLRIKVGDQLKPGIYIAHIAGDERIYNVRFIKAK